jgi:hypothetical protein
MASMQYPTAGDASGAANTQLPPGVRAITCRHCGRPAWLARLAPEMIRSSSRTKVIILEPCQLDGLGNVVLTQEHRAVFTGKFPGDLSRHRCPGLISNCKYCSAAVRILQQPPGSAERLAVLAPDPDPAGMIVITPEGWAVPDRDRRLPGDRYLWHRHIPGWRVCMACGMSTYCDPVLCAACGAGVTR